MQLYQALAVYRGDMVSFVGAGGKTTAMHRLAQELVTLDWHVVTTTTTLIHPPATEQCELTIVESSPLLLLKGLEQAIKSHSCITVASARMEDAKGKLRGLDFETLAQILKAPGVDAVLVEADGARGRSIKVPAPYEPPIPPSTSLVVPMLAVDAIGQRLDEDIAHRPERIAMLTGLEIGKSITTEVAATVLAHPKGGLKNAPAAARVCPLINKVESDDALAAAQEVARRLISNERMERVLLSSLSKANPVVECWTRTAAVILAAGESRRMGRPKQLIPWRGKTMLQRVVDAALASEVQEVIVVLGYKAEEIGATLKGYRVKIALSHDWGLAMSASLHAGLAALDPRTEACLFLLADQPKVTPQLINSLIARHRRTLAPIITPAYRGRRGNPVIFSRAVFPELAALKGDEGGRSIIAKHHAELERVEVDSPDYFVDIDTMEDLHEVTR